MTDQHITIPEASERTGYTQPEIRRKLQSGAWIAVAMAELRHHNGVAAGFGVVTVPQEVVRQMFMNRQPEYSFDTGGSLTATIPSDPSLLEVAVGGSENPLIDVKPGHRLLSASASPFLPVPNTVNPQHSVRDTVGLLAQLDQHVAAFNKGDPAARKKTQTVFVSHRLHATTKIKRPPITEATPATPQTHAVGNQAPTKQKQTSTWHLHEPIRDDGLAKTLYLHLKKYREAGKRIPTPRQILSDWIASPPEDISEVTKSGVRYIPTGKGRGSEDIAGLSKRIYKLTHHRAIKKTTP